jgi:signal transduction histidine kinase
MTNVAKHARASMVTVTVRRVDDAIELIVADDGVGCDARQRARALREGHVGLASAAERAAAARGELRLRSAPGEGTIVGVRLPSPVRREAGVARPGEAGVAWR